MRQINGKTLLNLTRKRAKRVFWAACMIGFAPAAFAQDLRDCPLNRLTFLDYWSGAMLEIDRSFGGFKYLCSEGGKVTERTENGEDCRRVGDIHLGGRLDGQPVVATYSVIWGSPCCSWAMVPLEVFLSNADNAAAAYRQTDKAPALGMSGIYPMIEQSPFQGDNDITPINALVPVACRK